MLVELTVGVTDPEGVTVSEGVTVTVVSGPAVVNVWPPSASGRDQRQQAEGVTTG